MTSMVVHGHSPRLTLSYPADGRSFQSSRNDSQSRVMPRERPSVRSSSRMLPASRPASRTPYACKRRISMRPPGDSSPPRPRAPEVIGVFRAPCAKALGVPSANSEVSSSEGRAQRCCSSSARGHREGSDATGSLSRDIDGVLARSADGIGTGIWTHVHSGENGLARGFADVVVSSTWRHGKTVAELRGDPGGGGVHRRRSGQDPDRRARRRPGEEITA